MKATLTQCAKALELSGGNIFEAAKTLGMTRQALWERVGRHERLQQIVAQAGEELNDIAEGNVAKAIREGDVKVSQWRLAQQARHRGYGKVSLEDDQLAKVLERMDPAALKEIADGD